MNQEIQVDIRPLSKDRCLNNISTALAKLLSQAQACVQELQKVHLEIFEHPRQFWRKRSIHCLKSKWCPAIQGQSGKQRHYIGIRVSFRFRS